MEFSKHGFRHQRRHCISNLGVLWTGFSSTFASCHSWSKKLKIVRKGLQPGHFPNCWYSILLIMDTVFRNRPHGPGNFSGMHLIIISFLGSRVFQDLAAILSWRYAGKPVLYFDIMVARLVIIN